MLEIQTFIEAHSDWEKLLAAAPYALKIKRKGSLVMFSYTQGESEPCEIVNEARGLILDEAESFRVVRYGLKRFYNEGEAGAAQIDLSTAWATEKIDGSLVMLYYYDGWHMSTRSTFDARDASVGTTGLTFEDLIKRAMKTQHLSFDMFNTCYTYVFELVSPESQVIIHYPQTALYFLMARDNITLEEVDLWSSSKLLRPDQYRVTTMKEIQEYVSKFKGEQFEGLVVEDAQHHRVKVKNLNWLRLHKLYNNGRMDDEAALELIMSGEDSEYLTYFPQHRKLFERVRRFYSATKLGANLADGRDYLTMCGSRKEFAFFVKEHYKGGDVPMMFKAFDGKAYPWVCSMTAKQFVRTFGTDGRLGAE